MVTPTDGIDLVVSSGIPVRPEGPSTVSLQTDDGAWRSAVVITRQAPLGSSDLAQLQRETERPRRDLTLFVVPRLTAAGRKIALDDHAIAIAAVDDSIVVFDGDERRPLRSRGLQPPAKLPRRRPWGRFAVMRSLLRTPQPRSQAALAVESGLTQPAVSQTLAALADVERVGSGWRTTRPADLWRDILAHYPGPGGISTRWFGLPPVREQANRAASRVPDSLISGDVAADTLAPWRKPRTATVYGHRWADLAEDGFAASGPERATLELILPADQTIWATAAAWNTSDGRADTADPLVTAWDVQRSGGPDTLDAIEHLKGMVLARW